MFDGIRAFANTNIENVQRVLSIEAIPNIINTILSQYATLTPREFMTLFSPMKTYDGAKYGIKDYFSTMKAVNKIGLDNPIGEDVLEFLWAYHSDPVIDFAMFLIELIDSIRNEQGEESVIVSFMKSKNVELFQTFDFGTGRLHVIGDKGTNYMTGGMLK